MTIVKYLDPKNDVAFKKIFGTEKNKDIVIHFLNDVLGKTGLEAIKDVKFQDPNQHPEIITDKQSIVDVLCTDELGVQYIVEMQVGHCKGFEKRAQYYAAKAYSAQANPGDETYIHLKEVIFLAITNFIMFPNKKRYKSDHIILDKESYERDLEDFSFTFIELPKFKKDISELNTYADKWCYFFKHASNPENIKKLISTSDKVIKKAFRALEAHHWTDDELKLYEKAKKISMDNKAREDYLQDFEDRVNSLHVKVEARKAEVEARKAEVKLRESEVEAEKAIIEAREKQAGSKVKEEKIKIAKNLLKKGLDIDSVTELTGLSKAEIYEYEKI